MINIVGVDVILRTGAENADAVAGVGSHAGIGNRSGTTSGVGSKFAEYLVGVVIGPALLDSLWAS